MTVIHYYIQLFDLLIYIHTHLQHQKASMISDQAETKSYTFRIMSHTTQVSIHVLPLSATESVDETKSTAVEIPPPTLKVL
ncbi:uncharacterized protein LOC100573289 [Acyrthosiphon pisum]|uniref:Uncharacterized protein n=1 Tax=Acyrthosiphon pisum TaxID=7029 RepID=A0A8R2JKY3_ACYPI|nr:uncharacterized protein LOC100573289 [Acyrthosiphon pisum]